MFENILFATTASPTCDDAAKVAFDLALKYDSKRLSVSLVFTKLKYTLNIPQTRSSICHTYKSLHRGPKNYLSNIIQSIIARL